MSVTYLPFYLSRAIIVSFFCFSTIGLNIEAGCWALGIFGLMVFYLHSGWFSVDLDKPFFPLKRDQFALDVQRKSLITAVSISILFNLLLNLFPWITSYYPILDISILSLGVILYFVSQTYQFLLPRIKRA